MRIAVLFDGAGLARLGLENAGHECTGYEINTIAHYLSKYVGSGNCILGDVRDFDYSHFDGIWASPPCQIRSVARTQGQPEKLFSDDLLDWSLSLGLKYKLKVLWVENIMMKKKNANNWGLRFNAGQFLKIPI